MERTVDDIEHLRELIGADRVVIAGHSFGGAVAAEYATRYPSRTAAVIMIDTTHDMGRALEYQVQRLALIADSTYTDVAQRLNAIARSDEGSLNKLLAMHQLVGRVPLQREVMFVDRESQERMDTLDRESELMACTSGNAVAAFATQGYLSKAMPSVARRLNAPTLLIAGSRSHAIGAKNILSAADTWGARVEWIDAGHFVYFDRPLEFAQAVERFLAQSVRTSSPR